MEQSVKKITKASIPLMQRDSLRRQNLSLNIRRYTTDVTGQILDDAVVPADQRKPYPFHLFGHFDREGGFSIADSVLRGVYNTVLFSVYVHGLNTPMFFFSPVATINGVIKKGDLVFLYVDDINAPSYFHFVVVSSASVVGGYASLISQSNVTQLDDNGHWGVFKFFDFNMTWIDDEQLNTSIYIIKTKYNAAFKSDPVNPEAYRFVENKSNVKNVLVSVEMLISQYMGLSGFIAWENQLVNLSFNLYS